MIEFALLSTALLFGGMVLYSFGFAAFVFKSLPAETAGSLLRKAFPHFYLFVLITSALAAALTLSSDLTSSIILGVIVVTTLFARQILMPAINAATDAGLKLRFSVLHTFSVLITTGHMVGAGIVIIQLSRV